MTNQMPHRAIRTVYLEPSWRLHSLYGELIDYPPAGWRVMTARNPIAAVVETAGRQRTLHTLKRSVVNHVVPATLAKSMVESVVVTRPHGADLTYASQHVVFRREPWVVDVEIGYVLAGGALALFSTWRPVIRRALESSYCRRIIAWSRACAAGLERMLEGSSAIDKVRVVPVARHANRSFARSTRTGGEPTRLLFVNSVNIPDQFDMKGGKEVFATYAELRRRGLDITLTVRSDVPASTRRAFEDDGRVRIISRTLTRTELEDEFAKADVFLYPSHVTPGMAMLDAMSYQLPVVTVDVYANAEIVEHGVTGLVVPPAGNVDYDALYGCPEQVTRQLKQIQRLDAGVVHRLADAVQELATNRDAAGRLGRAGRAMIDTGRFSIGVRNAALAEVFEQAIGT